MKDDLVKPSVVIPRLLWDALMRKAAQKGVPPSNLLWVAIDNELDAANPFDYPCPKPEAVFVQYAYQEEAGRIFQFLTKFQKGVTVETLVAMRREIGLPNKTTILLALRELLHGGLAIQSNTKPSGSFYNQFREGHVWVRLTNETLEYVEKDNQKLKEKISKLSKEQEKLDHKMALMKPAQKEWE